MQKKELEKEIKLDNEHGKIWAQWSFLEHAQTQRSKKWYTVALILAILLIGYSLLVANFLFALIVILGGFIVLFSSKQPQENIFFSLTEDGLELNTQFYPYKDISKFWIIYQPPEVKNIYFDFKNFLHPRLIIPLDEQDPVKIREILLKYLVEDLEKEDEPVSEYLKRILKL